MNLTLETIAFARLNPGATLGAATAVAGDSLQARNSRGRVSIMDWWGAQDHAGGIQQLIWNTGHDTTRNLRVNVNAGEYDTRIVRGIYPQLQPQEVISASLSGGAGATVVEIGVLTMLYQDLPSSRLNGLTYKEVQERKIRDTTIQATLTGGATPNGGWTGEELINAETALLHANTNYALLGMTVDIDVPAVAMRGIFSGNMRVGVPGDAGNVTFGADYFCQLARWSGLPLIPVFNSGDASATYFSFLQNETAVNPLVTAYVAELK